jgi:hypothetical protein
VALSRDPTFRPWRRRVPPWLWHAIGLALAALLGFLIWRGYQNPDFLLDFGPFRLC